MVGNVLEETTDRLAHMHHATLLRHIHEAVQTTTAYGWEKGRLVLDADAIARRIAKLVDEGILTERDIIAIPDGVSPQIATLQTDDIRGTRAQARAITDTLRAQIAALAAEAKKTPQELLGAHLEPITTGTAIAQGGRATQTLAAVDHAVRRTMTFRRSGGADVKARWHRCQITLESPRDLPQALSRGIADYAVDALRLPRAEVEERLADEIASREPALSAARQGQSTLMRLCSGLVDESVGQVKKAAFFAYLEYLADRTTDEGPHTLKDLLRRLRRLQAFLDNADHSRTEPYTDADYTLSFMYGTYDLRVLFGPAYAFDDLPVAPLFDGSVGESTDFVEERCTYIFGVRMKLNGPVQSDEGESVYEYHLRKLRGQTAVQRENNMLVRFPHEYAELVRLGVLYYVAFAHATESGFDPVSALRSDVLDPLTTTSGDAYDVQAAALAHIADLCANGQPDVVREMTLRIMKQRAEHGRRVWPVELALRSTIVHGRSQFLQEPLRPDVVASDRKLYLRHLAVHPRGELDVQAVLRLRGEISIDDLHIYEDQQAQSAESYQIAYAVGGRPMLRVDLALAASRPEPLPPHPTVPAHPLPGLTLRYFIRQDQIASVHRDHPLLWFAYRYALAVIAYLGIAALLEHAPLDTFIAVSRLHRRAASDGHQEGPESFLRTLGKSIAFVLGHDWDANSQGLVVGAEGYVVKNAVESLLAPLPKRFTAPHGASPLTFPLDKVALVVVSSRATDRANKRSDDALSLVYGEISEVVRERDDQGIEGIVVRRLRTFSAPCRTRDIASRPDAIIDAIHQLATDGYRHIIYLAQSPYTSKLHLTQRDDEQRRDLDRAGLYYLSPEIIQALLAHGAHHHASTDLRIYPVFRDRYPAMAVGTFSGATWEIIDIRELQQIVEDRSAGRQLAVIFNLFTNRHVDRRLAANRYHSVVSYATLLHYYDTTLNEHAILDGLIRPGSSRDTLLRTLTLFHLARNETSAAEVVAKLDPYDDIIGDESVGALAVRQHLSAHYQFNFLAFLTLLRDAWRATSASAHERQEQVSQTGATPDAAARDDQAEGRSAG